VGRLSLNAGACLTLALTAAPAAAAVREPNGINVPGPAAAGETSLQSYFDGQGEAVSALDDAAVDPGVFLPLCDFQVTLVLSQSQAQAGIAWYNVPQSPTGAPAAGALHVVLPPGTAVGQVITSADVRGDAAYAGGLVGFVLMKNGAPVYYSEYQRNAYCSGCATPGYWKMALAYPSKKVADTYYLAFEDWEGADQSSWQGNDGDFNDKVFRISGVTCDGGGAPCDTGQPGVCAGGVTQCQAGGAIVCKPQVAAGAERCDNLDNDCDGVVDDGDDLCGAGRVCLQGVCVPRCGAAEFDCVDPFVCDDGLCVEARCIGKACPAGQLCRNGSCLGGCTGVTCPRGQSCQLGVCVDPCANVTCTTGVCEQGACVTSCDCRTCPTGQSCAASGRCVDDGCQARTCGAGEVCREGACVDACDGAVCPGGAACRGGVCDPPVLPPVRSTGSGAGGAGGTTAPTGLGGAFVITGLAGSEGHTTGSAGSAPGDAGSVTDAATGGPRPGGARMGCACDAGGAPASAATLTLLLLVSVSSAQRKRRAG
jgi:hypothetical protein